MATSAAGARASRRAAAKQAAAAAPVVTAAPVEVPETLADVIDADVDEAFGPESVVTPIKTVAPAPDRDENHGAESYVTKGTGVPVRADKIPGGAIALPMEDLTRKIDAGDLVMPKLRLSQAMSKANTLYATSKGTAGVAMGNWYNSQSGQNFGETVYFVPVDMRKSRALFVQGQGLMCRSFDLLQGEGDPGIACEGTLEERHSLPEASRGCPLRLWNDKTPPKCGVTYNYPGYIVTDIENPDKGKFVQAILQLRSAATQTAKQINTIVMNEGGGVWQNTILELGVVSASNTKGTFFNPTVEFYDTTDAPEFGRLRRRADSMARQIGSATLRASLENDIE